MRHLTTSCAVLRLPLTDYQSAYRLQGELVNRRAAGAIGDHLILVEHPHVLTIGRRGGDDHIRVGLDELSRRGICVWRVDRGGDITYHGPGQIVGYPIWSVDSFGCDLHALLRGYEEALIRALGDFGIPAFRDPAYTGVWTAKGKIASIGVGVKQRVTLHGFALNVNTDLDYFKLIYPCGMLDREMTSMQALTGRHYAVSEVQDRVVHRLAEVFDMEMLEGESHGGAAFSELAEVSSTPGRISEADGKPLGVIEIEHGVRRSPMPQYRRVL